MISRTLGPYQLVDKLGEGGMARCIARATQRANTLKRLESVVRAIRR
jgi:hypothetical protein